MINFDDLTRKAEVIHSALYVDESGTLYTKKDLYVVIPDKFLDGKLGSIDDTFNAVGFGMWCIGNNYAVDSTIAVMRYTPASTSILNIDDVKYRVMFFPSGSIVTDNVNLLKDDGLAFQVYDEFVAKGKNPFYMDYVDNVKIFQSAKQYAGADLRASPSILSTFAASRGRQVNDRTKYFRELLKVQDDLRKLPVDMIEGRSVLFGATNTTARLVGSYHSDAVVSALTNPSTELESVEELLRK